MIKIPSYLYLTLALLVVSSCAEAQEEKIRGRFVFNAIRALDDLRATPHGDTGLFAIDNLNSAYLWEDGKTTRLRHNLSKPALSPDGKWVAGHSAIDRKIMITDIQGKEIRSLSFDQQAGPVRWSPDGKKILYSIVLPSEEYDRLILKEYDLESDTHKHIADFGSHSSILWFEYSPDGKKIVLEVLNSKNEDIQGIYVLNGDDNWKPAKIPNTELASSGMWFPDSRHIAALRFNTRKGSKHAGAIYKLNIETWEETKIRDFDLLFLQPKLSKDGKYFYLCKSHGKGGSVVVLWPLDDPTKEIPVTQSYHIEDPKRYLAHPLYATDSNPDWWQGE